MNTVLNRHDLSSLNKMLSALNDAKKLRDQMNAAGIDTREHDATIEYLEKQATALKAEFFPSQM